MGQIGEGNLIPAKALTVIEGSYSHHPALNAPYDLKIFLTCERQEQRRRLMIREGDYFLSALPIKMAGMEAAPVRAVLVEG